MNDQEGSVLVLSFIFMLVLIVLVVAMGMSIGNEFHISRYEQNMTQAQYYAESSIEFASKLMDDDTKWDSSTNELLLNEQQNIENLLNGLQINSLTRETSASGDEFTITSTITFNGVSDSLQVTYRIVSDIQNLNIFDYPLASGHITNVNGEIEVDGEIAANDTINDNNNVKDTSGNPLPTGSIHEDLSGDSGELETDVLDDYFADAKTVRTRTIYNFNLFQNDTSNIVNGDCVLNIDDEIVVIEGNMNLAHDFYAMGSGILVIEGVLNSNGNSFNANYNPLTGLYEDDYAITYFEKNINLQVGHYKGMLMSKQNLNLNSGGAGEELEIIGSAFASNNLNLNPGTFIHDDGYVDILGDIAINNNITVGETSVEVINWQEFVD